MHSDHKNNNSSLVLKKPMNPTLQIQKSHSPDIRLRATKISPRNEYSARGLIRPLTSQVEKIKEKKREVSNRQVTFESNSIGVNSEDFEEMMIEEPEKMQITNSVIKGIVKDLEIVAITRVPSLKGQARPPLSNTSHNPYT